MKDTRIVVPLVQTVFLPQNAMGVRCIDRVRTKVYVDNLSRPAAGPVCLQGFYELDLEYHGLEGQRLYKHRVMLPLRSELPGDWQPAADYEAAELHCVITKPMLRILSPYVLEFGAGLAVEYVGDRVCRQEQGACDIPAGELAEEQQRLESKFGCGLAEGSGGGQAEKAPDKRSDNIEARMDRLFWRREQEPPEAAPTDNPPKEAAQNDMPQNDIPQNDMSQNNIIENDMPQNNISQNDMPQNNITGNDTTDISQTADSQPDNSQAEAKQSGHSLPVWQPRERGESGADGAEAPEPAAAGEHSLPVWQPKERGGAGGDMVSQSLRPAAVDKPEPNMNRFRSLLTTAAIARLEARGEKLQAAGADRDWGLREQLAEVVKEQVNEQVKSELGEEPSPAGAAAPDNDRKRVLGDDKMITNKQPEPPKAEAETAAAEILEKETQETETAEAAEAAAKAEALPEPLAAAAEAAGEALGDLAVEAAASGEAADDLAVEAAASGETADELAVETAESGEAADDPAVETMASGEAGEDQAAGALQPDNDIRQVNAAGVRLRVGSHGGREPVAAPGGGGGFNLKYYVVKPGDEPMGIALKHNISLDSLRASNGDGRLDGELAVGTVLRIPV